MDVALAAGTLLASVGLTYVACIRPMRQGRCAMGRAQPAAASDTTSAGERARGAEIAALRAQLAALRAQDTPPVPQSPALGQPRP